MPRRTLAIAGTSLLLGALGGTAIGATGVMSFKASLSGTQEVQKRGIPPAASGTFSATLSGSMLKWKLRVSHLTGAVTTAHIAHALKGNLGPVLVVLCNPCKSPMTTGNSKLSSGAVKAMKNGEAYLNVYTSKHPNGEVRGQIG
jgi:hypothetical protein